MYFCNFIGGNPGNQIFPFKKKIRFSNRILLSVHSQPSPETEVPFPASDKVHPDFPYPGALPSGRIKYSSNVIDFLPCKNMFSMLPFPSGLLKKSGTFFSNIFLLEAVSLFHISFLKIQILMFRLTCHGIKPYLPGKII